MEATIAMEKRTSSIKSKFKAAGIHLAVSGVIFLLLAYFIIFEWYPLPYFTADGGWQGIRIVALIDLVLGPLMTLIIFNPKKSGREIRFDLGIIALVQTSVLVWGVYTVYNERPVAIVHWDGEFFSMPSKNYQAQQISLDQLTQFSAEKPALIHAYRPLEIEKIHEVLTLSTEKQLAPFEQFQLYRPLKENWNEISAAQLSIDEIISHNADMKKELEVFLDEFGSQKNDYIYMPLNARYHNVILIFSKDGDVRGTLNAPYKN
ncbi:hypothetical protein [Nitrosomonas aestuarii]|uniref:hypothetical protein n=1 Tax=Nitrosomonas aestuarii TaxID=52441 RepID=UPI000D320150|nr:hypothetical protein [Nitrosomonas aestuarii]PTN11926.1 hypothetical protein C8R11_10662 [Nitrosomonas aestuarii]